MYPAFAPGELLKHLVSNHADTVAAVARLAPAGVADITTEAVRTPLAFVRVFQSNGSPTQAVRATAESTIDPAIPSPQVNAAITDDLFTTAGRVDADRDRKPGDAD